MLFVPTLSGTVGFEPVAVPKDPFHVYVRGSPSGSLEAVPSNVTVAWQPLVAETVWLEPAFATGGRLGGNKSAIAHGVSNPVVIKSCTAVPSRLAR